MTQDPQHSATPLGSTALSMLRQGEEWLARGEAAAAERCFAEAQRSAPGHPEPMRRRALVLHRLGRLEDAAELLRAALVLQPNDADLINQLGGVLGDAGRHAEAVDTFRRACETEPNSAAAWTNLGNALSLAQQTAESEMPLQRALELDPDRESARFLLAEAQMMMGRIDDSANQYRELLRRNPRSGQAWWGLANLKSVRLNPDDAQALERLTAERDLAPVERLTALFARAKALDDGQRPEDAFHAYVAANACGRQGFRWDAHGFDAWIAQLRAAFPMPAALPRGAAGSEVIFIVGLPRSASTLTEQILAAHPQVEGASELGDLGVVLREESRRRGRGLPEWAALASDDDWQRLGQRYLERTARWRERRPRFTDKAPSNWMFSAAIRRMLPGARIVHCVRDPVETCWSCFRQIFWSGHDYSYDLNDLAAYWRTCDLAMAEWRAASPEYLRRQVYEDLQADPEGQTRALLDFCGLSFDPACLRFHEVERSVRTVSAAQVRQPLDRATAKTQRYGRLLDPLRAALSV